MRAPPTPLAQLLLKLTSWQVLILLYGGFYLFNLAHEGIKADYDE